MDFAGGRHTKSCNEQTAAYDNQEYGGKLDIPNKLTPE